MIQGWSDHNLLLADYRFVWSVVSIKID